MPPAAIAGLTDARPFAPLEFSRAWLAKMAAVRSRRAELESIDALDGLAPEHAAALGAALSGTLRVPVVPVRYSDVPAPFSPSRLAKRLFGESVADTMSYTDYWAEVSGGLLRVEGVVTPWVRLPHGARHYLSRDEYGWARFGRVVDLREAALSAVDEVIDFGEFDNDGPDGVPNSGDDDGYVDFIAFVYALKCPGDGREGGIWPHRSAMAPLVTDDLGANGRPIRISDYVILPAVDPLTCGPLHIGLLAHETGHAIGLPDLYDYDASSQGIGGWGLMGSGSHVALHSPAHPSAWEKEQLGWVRTSWLREDSRRLRIEPVQSARTVYRYDTGPRGRYLLLENRQWVGSDSRLPGHGLLVWEVDPERGELGAWNADERRMAVSLVEADGLDDLRRGHLADAGDPFPGASSTSSFRAANDRNFRLSEIAEAADGAVTARLDLAYSPPAVVATPGVVRLTALAGGTSVGTIVDITRDGGAAFDVTPRTSSSWLHAESASDQLRLSAHPASLAPGTYADTVRLVDASGKSAARVLVSLYVAEPGVAQIVATELPWSWGLAARNGQILQASYGWDPLGLRPQPRVLELWDGAAHPETLSRIASDAVYAPSFAGDGTAYVLARAGGANQLHRIHPDGSAELVHDAVGAGPAYGVTALPDGSALVAEWTGTIHRVTRDGVRTVWDTVDARLYQIAADREGVVYAATFDGDVLRFDGRGAPARLRTGFGEGRLVAVAVGPSGAVYAAERGGKGRILRFDSSGRARTVYERSGAEFYGVAPDAGFLYALDLKQRHLLRIPLPVEKTGRRAER